MPHALQRLRPQDDRLFCPFQTDEQGHPGRRCLDVPATARRFDVGIPFERSDMTTGILKRDAVLEGNLVVAFGGGFTVVFVGVHDGEVWIHRHLLSSSKIVNLGTKKACNRAVWVDGFGMVDAALLFSLIALMLTKAADFWTTVRHVGPEAECNPLARKLFHQFGFIGGLVVVGLIWGIIVAAAYGYAWWLGSLLEQWITILAGLVIAWAQWDAARFNVTGHTSWFTRVAMARYRWWQSRWRSR